MKQNDPRKHMTERSRLSQVAALEEQIKEKEELLSKVKLTPEGYEAFSAEIRVLKGKLATLKTPLT